MLRHYFPNAYAPSVFAIDFEKLYAMGYRGLIFDVDNTLVHHGDDSTPEIDALFRHLHAIGFATLLLSNNDAPRLDRFNRNIGTRYIEDAAKPAPDNYLRAVEMLGLPSEQVLCIGDQVFVDILGANRCGLKSILVHYIETGNKEWIGFKRYIEKLILFLFRFRSSRHKLCNIRKQV